MKKINILLATLAMLVATVSCNNDEKIQIEEPGVPAGSIRVNISISDLQPTTKAVKTGWANGDIINIWFDKHVYQTPDLTMTYNNGAWAASEISNEIAAQLKTNGTLWGFYEASNSATTAWTFDDDGVPGQCATFKTPGSNWQTGTKGYLTVDFNNLSYTFDGTTLSAKLNDWYFGTDFQMIITGLDPTKTWIMKSYDVVNWYGKTQSFYGEDYEKGYSWYKLGGSNRPIIGMPNDEGLVFYGQLTSQITYLRDYTFTLYNTTDNIEYTFTKNAQLNSNYRKKLVAVKVPFNKFVVDMGLSVKWAACNLGAEYETDYGDLYAWAETTTKTKYHYPTYEYSNKNSSSPKLKKYCPDSAQGYSGYSDDLTTLEPEDDAATVAYGSSYRMPTIAEWEELLNTDNCIWTWTESYKESGIKGYVVTSKKTNYTNQSIFLPASGLIINSGTNNVNYCGYYWSSSLYDPEPWAANLVYFYQTQAKTTQMNRIYGFAIRPVR